MDDDDFFGGPSQGGVSDPLTEGEYNRIVTRYTDAGYREGITSGKLTTLQKGFDDGYALSVPASRKLGQLRGRAQALLAYSLSLSSSTSSSASVDTVGEIRSLISDLSTIRRNDILPKDLEREEHEKEEHGGESVVEKREDDVEGLEEGLGRLGGGEKEGVRMGGEVLGELEARLGVLIGRILGG